MKTQLIEKLLNKLLDWEETKGEVCQKETSDDMIWQYVIVRGYYSWVHFGKLESRNWYDIILTESRRLYRRWTKWIDLTALSQEWLIEENGETLKICKEIPKIQITDNTVCEIIPCNTKAIKSIKERKAYLP